LGTDVNSIRGSSSSIEVRSGPENPELKVRGRGGPWLRSFVRITSETVEKGDFGSLGLLRDPNVLVCHIW
jgi:hypothetical protein